MTRPRQLCRMCYYTPTIREQYPISSVHTYHGLHYVIRQVRPMPEPTTALPGTPEKVAVLAERARLHQLLWHPDDAHGYPNAIPWWCCRNVG
jgi:hypothetical protein